MTNENKLNVPRMETIKRTAEIVGVPEYFVRQKVKSGDVVAIKAGRKALVNADKFIEYLNTATFKAADEPTATAPNALNISPIPHG